MPCDWPIDRTCLPELPTLSDPPTPEEQGTYDAALAAQLAAEDLAVEVLWALSGRQFGLCPAKARPCPTRETPPWRDWPYGWPYVVMFDDGRWVNWPCGCGPRCSVSGPRAVHLPGPVAPPTLDDPIVVTVGDVVLTGDDFVLEGDVLYRKGANWPSQDLGKPLGETGTWSVEYLRGYRPPAGTAKFVGTLAAEFLKACSDEECRLPRTVTTASRRGVTYRVYDPAVIYADGKTGIPEIDLWLAAVNPYHLMAAPSVI